MAARNVIPLSDYNISFDSTLTCVADYIRLGRFSSVTVLVDEHTKIHCLPLLQAALGSEFTCNTIEITAGEAHKTLSTCEVVWAGLLELNVDRKGLLVNLGGGVIGDLGGFVASCFKRGIAFIQVPTTLLAQVDASVGGKLGVDFQYGKNIIGLFRNPGLVVVNTGFLGTLPDRQLKNGFSEIFKHALIRDAAQWESLQQLTTLRAGDIEPLVYHSVLIKKQVVEEDPYERNLRKILNFGHTLGHAVEAWSLGHDADPLLHGEAVVVGMIMEAFLSAAHCGLAAKDLENISGTLLRHYGHYALQADAGQLWPYLLMDKKNSDGKVQCVLLNAPGQPVTDMPLTLADVEQAVAYYRSLAV
jgi:3-dehydroquinate synthase